MRGTPDIVLSPIGWTGTVPKTLREIGLRHSLWESGHAKPLFLALWEGGRRDMSSLLGCRGHHAEEGFLGLIAEADSVPVGVLLLQRVDLALPATRWRTKRGGDMVPEKILPWQVRVRGILGVYVRPERRGLGLATRMLRAIERLRMAEAGPETWSPNDVPALVGSGRANTLIDRAARYHRVLNGLNDSLRQRREIDAIARETEWLRTGAGSMTLRDLEPWTSPLTVCASAG